jgi:hypothetical protein
MRAELGGERVSEGPLSQAPWVMMMVMMMAERSGAVRKAVEGHGGSGPCGVMDVHRIVEGSVGVGRLALLLAAVRRPKRWHRMQSDMCPGTSRVAALRQRQLTAAIGQRLSRRVCGVASQLKLS